MGQAFLYGQSGGGAKLRVYTGLTAPSDTGGIWIKTGLPVGEITISSELPASPSVSDIAVIQSSRPVYPKESLTNKSPYVFAQPVMAVRWDGSVWQPLDVFGYDTSAGDWVLRSNRELYFFTFNGTTNFSVYDINGNLVRIVAVPGDWISYGSAVATLHYVDPSTKSVYVLHIRSRYAGSSAYYNGRHVKQINYETGELVSERSNPSEVSGSAGSMTVSTAGFRISPSVAVAAGGSAPSFNYTGPVFRVDIGENGIENMTYSSNGGAHTSGVIPVAVESGVYYVSGQYMSGLSMVGPTGFSFPTRASPYVRTTALTIAANNEGAVLLFHAMDNNPQDDDTVRSTNSYMVAKNGTVVKSYTALSGLITGSVIKGVGLWKSDDEIFMPQGGGIGVYKLNADFTITRMALISGLGPATTGASPFFMDSMRRLHYISSQGVYRIEEDYTTTLLNTRANLFCSNMGEYAAFPEQYIPES